jgi:hypothetical protein
VKEARQKEDTKYDFPCVEVTERKEGHGKTFLR